MFWNNKCISSSCLYSHLLWMTEVTLKCFILHRKINNKQIHTENIRIQILFFLPSLTASIPFRRKVAGPSCYQESPKHTNIRCVCIKERRHIWKEIRFSFLFGVKPRIFLSLWVRAEGLGVPGGSPRWTWAFMALRAWRTEPQTILPYPSLLSWTHGFWDLLALAKISTSSLEVFLNTLNSSETRCRHTQAIQSTWNSLGWPRAQHPVRQRAGARRALPQAPPCPPPSSRAVCRGRERRPQRSSHSLHF